MLLISKETISLKWDNLCSFVPFVSGKTLVKQPFPRHLKDANPNFHLLCPVITYLLFLTADVGYICHLRQIFVHAFEVFTTQSVLQNKTNNGTSLKFQPSNAVLTSHAQLDIGIEVKRLDLSTIIGYLTATEFGDDSCYY
jgi:hypothetical protein